MRRSHSIVPDAVRGVLRGNGLTLVFTGLFVAALTGQAAVGIVAFNAEQRAAGLEPISLVRYLTSSAFAVDVTENWQSEYLQFLLYVVLTVWLVQRGSPESKPLDSPGRESDAEQKVGRYATPDSPSWVRRGGWRLAVYSRSLTLVMGAVFILSWAAQSITGAVAYSEEQMRNLQDPVDWAQYVTLPDFWGRTLQNWQSEFLAVASMVAFSIYLRERGSPESKPVGSPHDATGVEG